jgi:hypothetical protein
VGTAVYPTGEVEGLTVVVGIGTATPQFVTWSTKPLSDKDRTTLATGSDHSVRDGTV